MILVRKMKKADVRAAARVHAASFPRQQRSRTWLRANLAATPRTSLWVATQGGSIIGYIIWTQKSGFRQHVILELEQIAVAPAHRGAGIGSALIRKSLPSIEREFRKCGQRLQKILVSTRADNAAQWLYIRELNAIPVARISDLYSADEVILLARRG